MDSLIGMDIAVPVWDETRGSGANADYHVTTFAQIQLTDYDTRGQDTLSAIFLGFITCNADNTPPAVQILSPQDQTVLEFGVSENFSGTAVDAEDGDLTANLNWTSDQEAGIGNGGSFSATLSLGTHTITASVTDSGNLTGDDSIQVTIEDTLSPVISCPADTVIDTDLGSCNAVVTYDAPEVTDHDPAVITSLTSGLGSGGTFPLGTTTEIYTATDSSGNSTSCSFSVTVLDNETPTLDCPADITVNTDFGTPGAVVTYTEPIGSDNCPNASISQTAGLGSGATFPVGTTTETYTINDGAGNVNTCSFNVTVVDAEPPVALCQDRGVQLNENGIATITGADVDGGSHDASGIASLDVSPNSFDCSAIGVNPVVLTVTDNHGNVSSCTANVTVEDSVAPEVVCRDATVGLDANGNAAVTTADVDNGTQDACGIASLSVNPAILNTVEDHEVTLTATDTNGNTASCTAIVTVVDEQSPVITCPTDIVVNTDPQRCDAVVTYTPPVGIDNDPGATTVLTAGLGSGATFPLGSSTETYTASDTSGNSATCSFTITVVDNEAPAFICPADITVNTDPSSNGALVTYNAPTGTDNCPNTTVSQTAGLGSGATFPIGITTETYTISDAAGNSTSCSFTVTVIDVEPPGALCQDITASLDANGNTTITAEDVDAGSHDVSGIASLALDQTQFTCNDVGANTVVLTVTDNNGNTSTCTANVTVEDTIIPVALCQDISLALDANGSASISSDLVDNGSNDACGVADLSVAPDTVTGTGDHTVTLTVTDNNGNSASCDATVTALDTIPPVITCPPDIISECTGTDGTVVTFDPPTTDDPNASVACIPASGSLFPIGTTSVSCTATDPAGNSSGCSFAVTIEDTTAPTISYPENVTVNRSSPAGATVDFTVPTATDLCSNIVTVQCDPDAGTFFNLDITTVTCTATDNDSNAASCSFDISVINSPPTANAGPDQTVFVTDIVNLDGSASTDPNGDPLTYSWRIISEPASSAAVLTGADTVNPSIFIDAFGDYEIELIVNDSEFDSAPDTMTISTLNSPPVANAGPDQTVFVTDTVQLDGSASSDIDGDSLSFDWDFTEVPTGSAATLSDSTIVNPTFVVDLPGFYRIRLIVNDGLVDSVEDIVIISTENSSPVANAGPDQTARVGDTVTLDGSGSNDVDGDPLSFNWSFTSKPATSQATLSDPAAVMPTFDVDERDDYTLQLIVNDGQEDNAADTVTIHTENSPPEADAGPDQTVFVGDTVTLDASASSDVDGDPLAFFWSFTSIPQDSTATISDPGNVLTTFDVDKPGMYVVQLIVNDGFVDSAIDIVIVSTQNSPPVANAGPDQTVLVNDTVQLDGSASNDVDGDTLTFNWSFTSIPAGSAATLSDTTAVIPTFVVDIPGTYVAQLIVNDGTVNSAPDTVSISTENSPPVADAGSDQSVFVTDIAQLDGSASIEIDGDTLTYAWSLTSIPDGSAAILSDPTLVNPTFIVDLPGTYIAQLIVNDGTVNSNADSVTISTQNSKPVADAGPDQSIFVDDTVTLDGSGSNDVDSDTITFSWSFTSVPAASNATLSDSTGVAPTLTADVAGMYVVQLIVNDGTVDSDPDTVVITTQNRPPVANAGPDQNLDTGQSVTLDGSGSSDPDGDSLTYQWTFGNIPTGSTGVLTDETTVNPSFVPDLEGDYEIQLIVNDGTEDSLPDVVIVTVTNPTVLIPHLRGMTQADAEFVIDAFNLTVGTIDNANHPDVPDGRVSSQAPAGGTEVPQGTIIDITVSLGPVFVTVPDVVGLPEAVAETAITNVNLGVFPVTRRENSDTVPTGNVISQDPIAGTTVEENDEVKLIVSLGQIPVVQDDNYEITDDNSLTIAAPGVLDNDSDPDGDTLTATLLNDVIAGSLVFNADGSFTYTPDPGFNQAVSFTYFVNDGLNDSDIATVTIDRFCVNVEPIAIDTNGTTTNSQTLEISGMVAVDYQNTGTCTYTGSFDALIYEDRNLNETFDATDDVVLGTKNFNGSIAPNATVTLNVPVSGTVLFANGPICLQSPIPLCSGQNSVAPVDFSAIQPVVEWFWEDSSGFSVSGSDRTSVVAPLIDTNGDAQIDEQDIPAVILTSGGSGTIACGGPCNGQLVALRGDTGEEIFAVRNPAPIRWQSWGATPTVGDIDNDGRPEILAVGQDVGLVHTLMAFNNDGSLKWAVPNLRIPKNPNVTLADLNGDGQSEIIYGTKIINSDGSERPPVIDPIVIGQGIALGAATLVADLDLDGVPEIVGGASARDNEGNLLWGWTSNINTTTREYDATGWLDGGDTIVNVSSPGYRFFNGHAAVANLDADPNPEIIVVNAESSNSGVNELRNDNFTIFEHDGRIKAGPFGLFADVQNVVTYHLGPPTVADFTGDGELEIAISAVKNKGGLAVPDDHHLTIVTLYRQDGSLIWQREVSGEFFQDPVVPAPVAFDFDGDGASEVVFLDHEDLVILNGANGEILFEMGTSRVTSTRTIYPTIADIDNDGSAEIIVPSSTTHLNGSRPLKGVLILGDANGNWNHARRTWNQWHYQVTHINEDASIPSVARNSLEVNNGYFEQIPRENVNPLAAADLSVSLIIPEIENCPSGATNITARIGNGGSLQARAGIPVKFYNGDPNIDGTLIGTSETSGILLPGEKEDVAIACIDPVPSQIYVTVNETPQPVVQTSADIIAPLVEKRAVWARVNGLSSGGFIIGQNWNAFRALDGDSITRWNARQYGNREIDLGPEYFEVRFLFPVNVDSIDVENFITGSTSGSFLTGQLTFSNGDSLDVTFTSGGEGTFTFAEKTDITWIRLTATSTSSVGAGLTDFRVGGSFAEPAILTRESDLNNNTTSCGDGLSPCDERPNEPPVITSSPITRTLVDEPYTYQVIAEDPNDVNLTYSLAPFPTGMTIDPNTGLISWTPNNMQLGNIPVTVRVEDPQGLADTQSFTVRVTFPVTTPNVVDTPQADAENTITLASLSVGTISTANSAAITAGNVISQTPLADTQVPETTPVDLVVSKGQVPVADAGPDQDVGESELVTLDGLGSSDPDGDTITFTWIQSGGLPVILSDPNAIQPTFTSPSGFDQPIFEPNLEIILRFDLTVFDGIQTNTDTVTITVTDTNDDPPVADAGQDQFVQRHAFVTLDATNSFDPEGSSITYEWNLLTVPNGNTATLDDPTSPTPEFRPNVDGEYIAELTVRDANLQESTDRISVTVNQDSTSPTAILSVEPYFVDAGKAVALAVTATDNKGIGRIDTTVDGSAVLLDENNIGTFTTGIAGEHRAQAIVTDVAGNQAFAEATFIVIAARPAVEIISPADGDVITSPADIIGSVTDGNLQSYALSYALFDTDNFTEFARGTDIVINDVLGTFDPTLLENDIYTIRLTATDEGGLTSIIEQQINVTSDLKVGNFRLSFVDLAIPVSGIPIQLIRTYDTLQSSFSSDFGFGWRMELRDTKLRTSVLKTGLEEFDIYNPFIYGTRVYVTTPDGRRVGFTFEPVLSSSFVKQILKLHEPRFTPDPGVYDTLEVAHFDLIIDQQGDRWPPRPNRKGDLVYTFGGSLVYNPVNPAYGGGRFFLTTKDGLRYEINGLTGKLRKVTDRNNNNLTYTNDGVIHSSGKEITFARDAQNRITAVTDPMGNDITYGYDASGDLVSVTDREGNETQFTYFVDHPHFLDEVINALGNTGVRTEYDENGRLIKSFDALGNPIEFIHDLDNNTEVIFDRLGNPTTYIYDDRGNVLSEIDALGGTITRTYDNDDNMLTEIDQLGNVTTFTYDDRGNELSHADPLGHTTTTTYNILNQPTTIVDQRGLITSYEYDSRGNLLTWTNPLGEVVANQYDPAGNLISEVDAIGNSTTFEYNTQGNLVRQINALGHSTESTYDDNGNKLTETTTRTTPNSVETMVTTFEYDDEGRTTKVINPDGSFTETVYNEFGKETAKIDELGRQTEMIYNDRQELIQTLYPDGTSTSTTYDDNGKNNGETDQAGFTTTFEYDTLGRLLKTIQPDGAETSSVYDAAGRTIESIDTLGNSTTHEYDAAGRRIRTTNALTQATSFTHDQNGNLISFTDALNRTTQYTYDDLNRRTTTIFPDNSTQHSTYDTLGRRIAETDQAGVQTLFGYDALGRLTSVTDALGGITQYTYDETGNQLQQIDANGRVTRYEYDNRGRRNKRILPLGQEETMTYDSTGNLASRTDFNGRTTTYTYNPMNRLLSKTPDSAFNAAPISFTYDNRGNRASMTDLSGVTTYQYDDHGRLLVKDTPIGSLNYSYDAQRNLTSVNSSNTEGVNLSYTYDELNRLESVTSSTLGVTSYTYDDVGNLGTVLYPNDILSEYQYTSLNRLENMVITHQGNSVESYHYTLSVTGHRTGVTEGNGRTIQYTYDNLYRLTSETIAGTSPVSGTIDYQLDPVGNRLQRTSTVSGVSSDTYHYNSNDRLTSDDYDDNGNTILSQGNRDKYDFENRLIKRTTSSGDVIEIVYDGDGNRVSKSVNGQTANYLVDTNNLTGYSQVFEELVDNSSQLSVVRRYTYGNDLLAQEQLSQSTLTWLPNFYAYDGHGNVRFLTDESGIISDTYDYDGFGILIFQTGTTSNNYLYTGEQLDLDLSLYFLRARYMDQDNGRFWSMDGFEGLKQEPTSLHKYLYATANPIK